MQTDGHYSRIKFHLTASQQVALLKSRGMIFRDERQAQTSLLNLGYYRFAGYFYPFRATNPLGVPGRQDTFRPGTTFEAVEQLCEFDRRIRLLTLDATAVIEVSVRCDIAHRLGARHRLAHEQPHLLDADFCSRIDENTKMTKYDAWKQKLSSALHRSRKEDFVKHHNEKYAGKLPIWAVTEVWDFGLLSHFFSGIQFKDQRYIAAGYGLKDGQYLASWLRNLNFVRNVAAHHSRLWNRNIVERFKLPPLDVNHHLHHLRSNTHAQTRLYGSLCLMQFLIKKISPSYPWGLELAKLCATFPQSDIVSLKDAGFPDNWQMLPFWGER